ncbi:GNAT family N-acetyltransferase [Actinocatenispora rupis]|uniref:N-acetyltransferase n=1 Tax=Actinocatenispora rupis TaxID=519421 RepID=A0A8J3J8H3_9ACTN|nr:N-acetyltransferase [Actinocatenispora rupis]GID12084.1 N-acetyltransferase [Actinocatenispora rupis]
MAEWRIRPERDADRTAVHAVNEAAFGRAYEADLVDRLRDDPGWLPGLSYVAEAPDGRVVGHVLLTRGYVGDVPVVALGPLAVVPDSQRRGLGGLLVGSALDAAEARGETAVMLLGHPGYYPRFGFERASAHGVTPPDPRWPDEAFQVRPVGPDGTVPAGGARFAAAFDED